MESTSDISKTTPQTTLTQITPSSSSTNHTITPNPNLPVAAHTAATAVTILPPQTMGQFNSRLREIRDNFTNIHDITDANVKISKLKEMKQGLSVLLQSDMQTNDVQAFDKQLKAIETLSSVIEDCIENEESKNLAAVSTRSPVISEEASYRQGVLNDLNETLSDYLTSRNNRGLAGDTETSKVLKSMITTIENKSANSENRLTEEECRSLKGQSTWLNQEATKNKNLKYNQMTTIRLNTFLKTTLEKY